MGYGDRRRMKADEQCRLIVELWQQRPRWQRGPDDLLRFYGWLSEHEPAVIPSGPGSFQRIRMILMPHVIETTESAATAETARAVGPL